MKKLIILIVTFFSFSSYSQLDIGYTEKFIEKGIVKGTWQTMNRSIVVAMDGSAEEIYQKTKKWINETYNDPNEVIKADTENEYIRLNGRASSFLKMTALGSSIFYDIRYSFEIRFKDGRFKFDIIDLDQFFESSTYSSAQWAKISNIKVKNKKGKPVKDGVYNTNKLNTYFNDIINGIKDYKSESAKNDGDDW